MEVTMGWFGYGIYDGDETQTEHCDFLKWAKIGRDDDERSEYFGNKGTILPLDLRERLIKNTPLILKKMPKVPKSKFHMFDEYSAITWHMLLALFIDNQIVPTKEIFEKGINATEYLMGEHADDFNSPYKRRKKLKEFIAKAEKLCYDGYKLPGGRDRWFKTLRKPVEV